ncbi:hypothetical protein B0H11DRAFT_2245548 [Mycena galericulata]|nr:hypothetical protein B0H11DRAFT_2245548 [Mycena galericulata]
MPQSIRAIDSHSMWNLPEVMSWKPHLQSLGARLEHHFIIILSDYGDFNSAPPTPPLSPPSATGSPQSSRQGSTPHDSYATRTVSPIFPSVEFNDPSSYRLLEHSSFGSHMGITPSTTLLSITGPSDSTHNTNFDPSWFSGISTTCAPNLIAENPPTVIDWSHFVPGLSIDGVFSLAGITAEEEIMSRYNPGNQSLWEMIQNHRSASGILDRFGLSNEKPTSRVQFQGGLILTTEQVVQHLRWSPRTFTRKSASYRLARKVATYSWQGLPPTVIPSISESKETKATRKFYLLHLGVVAMFRTGGFADQSLAPSRRDALLANPERRAALLTQNNLYENLNRLSSDFLEVPT